MTSRAFGAAFCFTTLVVVAAFASGRIETASVDGAIRVVIDVNRFDCDSAGDDVLANGLAVDLVHALSDTRALSVRLAAANGPKALQDHTHVQVKLHCSQNDQIALFAVMTDAAGNVARPALTFDSNFEGRFGMRADLTEAILKSLAPDERVRRDCVPDAAAYHRYLDVAGRSVEPAGRIRDLQDASLLEEDFAPLWARLGKAQLQLAESEIENAVAGFAEAEASLRRSIELQPHDPFAIEALAAVYMRTGRTEEAVLLLRDAIRNRPYSAALRARLGYALRYAGLLTESVREYRRSMQLDTSAGHAIGAQGQIAKALIYQGRYAAALETYREIRSLMRAISQPVDEKTLFYEGLTQLYLQDEAAAVQSFDAANAVETDSVWSRFALAYKFAALARQEELQKMARQLESDNVADGERRYRLAHFHALAGNEAEAVTQLEMAVDAGNFNYTYMSRDPLLESLRDNPRYAELLGKTNKRQLQPTDNWTLASEGVE